MTVASFITILVFLLLVFQWLQIYFFRRGQNLIGAVFVGFFWITFSFMVYNGGILFSSNYTGSGQIRPQTIVIQKGATLSHISDQLLENKIIKSRNNFLWTANLMGFANKMKAGKFIVVPTMSNYDLVNLLSTSVSAVQDRVTVIEGLTAKEIASLFSQKLDIDSTMFIQIVFDSVFTAAYNIPADNMEGYLYPETYNFNYGVSEEEIIESLLQEFYKNITDTMRADIEKSGMSLHEIVTMASIIEGEAVLDDERPLISSVYHNRLKQRWLLQADPTIQYIIPDGPRRLLNADLEIDSPYNTYKYKGLPPGPINNPGILSIKAAVYPASESYLFFVATGDGHHTFSRTQEEHLQAKKILDRLRRDLHRQPDPKN
ncbi:endolytic transglycosylase MltG [candidate division KSB1 bacterium]